MRADFPNAAFYVDPQFYVNNVGATEIGRLGEYPNLFYGNLNRRDLSSPKNIQSYVKNAIDFQHSYLASRLLTPSVLIDDFTGGWSQIAVNLISASVEYAETLGLSHELRPHLLIRESALSSRNAADDFLEVVTTLDVPGFILTIDRESSRPQANTEANLLNFIYTLAAENSYEVVVSHSGLNGILYHAGWRVCNCNGMVFESATIFNWTFFSPSKQGGRRPRPRYLSRQLLSSILILPELSSIYSRGEQRRVLSGTNYDGRYRTIAPTLDDWPLDVSVLHNWSVMKTLCSVFDGKNLPERLEYLDQIVGDSITLSEDLKHYHLFETATFDHLRVWAQIAQQFRLDQGL